MSLTQADYEKSLREAFAKVSPQVEIDPHNYVDLGEDKMTDVVNKPAIKWCGRCRQSLPRENFAKNSAKKDGLQERCKDCRAEHYKSTGYADKAYENRIKRQYNLSLDELKWFEEQQEGCCAICKDNTPKLFVDHDHMTGEVRGLLCHYCNTGIGLFMDNPDRLKSAIQYLTEGTYDRYGE